MTDARRPIERPLSPHLQVYRLTITMVMSGAHRITGFFLYFGSILFVWWILAAASGPNAFATISWLLDSWIGRFVLLGYTWTLLHHMFGGIRHFIWDLGLSMGPGERDWLAAATLIASLSLTVILWVIAYFAMGGLR